MTGMWVGETSVNVLEGHRPWVGLRCSVLQDMMACMWKAMCREAGTAGSGFVLFVLLFVFCGCGCQRKEEGYSQSVSYLGCLISWQGCASTLPSGTPLCLWEINQWSGNPVRSLSEVKLEPLTHWEGTKFH